MARRPPTAVIEEDKMPVPGAWITSRDKDSPNFGKRVYAYACQDCKDDGLKTVYFRDREMETVYSAVQPCDCEVGQWIGNHWKNSGSLDTPHRLAIEKRSVMISEVEYEAFWKKRHDERSSGPGEEADEPEPDSRADSGGDVEITV